MRLILVGGFLGAGKTTLLGQCARRLAEMGMTVGLITNDQAPDLVDTALLSRAASRVREVTGSCFCCDFNGLVEAVNSLVDSGADCIVAEPVGSCTDLSATIVQPIKSLLPSYRVAPLTVLIDPARIREALQGKRQTLHPDAVYILRLQLEEADEILLNKIDTLSSEKRAEFELYLNGNFPRARVAGISAQTGEGVDEWLERILREGPAGTHIVDVDYDRYANGEAVLGWLNAAIHLRWTSGSAPDRERFVLRLMESLRDQLREAEGEIGHVKLLLEDSGGSLAANLTGLNDEVSLRSDGDLADPSAVLTVNARVQLPPEGIERLFRSVLDDVSKTSSTATIKSFYCLKPGRPRPTHRFDAVVK